LLFLITFFALRVGALPAAELDVFQLYSFACTHGAGLATRGDEREGGGFGEHAQLAVVLAPIPAHSSDVRRAMLIAQPWMASTGTRRLFIEKQAVAGTRGGDSNSAKFESAQDLNL